MNLEQSQRNDFENRLAYFGAAITASPAEFRHEYQDLEKFFVDATLMMAYDVRITQAFLNWLMRYGVILCPSKIRKTISSIDYHPSVLGAFVSYLIQYDSHPQRWNLLNKFTRFKIKEHSL